MTAASNKKVRGQEPDDVEMLLPWHAAGTLNARDARRVEEALASDPELARQYAVIREEYAETIGLNESLGAPSARAMQKLFAAIDAEPERKPSVGARMSARISEFFFRIVAADARPGRPASVRSWCCCRRADRRGADAAASRPRSRPHRSMPPNNAARAKRAVAPSSPAPECADHP